MKKNGETDPLRALRDLQDRGEYRNFAILERQAESPMSAALHGNTGLSVDARTLASDIDSNANQTVSVWCSNDYLGMSRHPVVAQGMTSALKRIGAGAGGTRNIAGTNIYHVALEQELASLHGKESALIFTSGYNANQGALGVLGRYLQDCVIYSDSMNHASMIAGIRASKAEYQIWRHNDLAHLKHLLEQAPASAPRLIALESVYSMDGDFGPIKEVCNLAEEFGAHIYLDEVHAVGMYGKGGAGLANQLGQDSRVDIIQGTLGKAYGVQGGYIAGSRVLIDLIRSFAPDFIFSTSMSPVLAAGALASIQHLRRSDCERQIQRTQVMRLKSILRQKAIPFMDAPSHIVPVIIEGADNCVAAAKSLLEDWNIYAQPIVYPTVPRGTERLRLTPSPLHSEEDMANLGEALSSILTLQKMSGAA